jgi:pimeloyl-ACP methyl ester carboxylesterase
MRRRILSILLTLLLAPSIISMVVGWLVAPSFLHPERRPLTPDLVQQADVSFASIGVHRQPLDVHAPDGVLLRGWKVPAAQPNGAWVLLFHGVADNRMGVLEHALILLRAGYSVTLMDTRAHGESEGAIATYGWLERQDTSAVIDALVAAEHPAHIFALGESMGAGIALQSAGVDPRIEAVVAEAPFASLREASYDYAGLQSHPRLGKTLFAPGAWVMLARGQSIAGFSAADVSPEHAVASRAFPVLLICDAADTTLPCRHAKMIYDAARGPKSLWRVPLAYHTGALGYQPAEFRCRVLQFFADPTLGGVHATEGATDSCSPFAACAACACHSSLSRRTVSRMRTANSAMVSKRDCACSGSSTFLCRNSTNNSSALPRIPVSGLFSSCRNTAPKSNSSVC